jgi:hypothetical protein
MKVQEDSYWYIDGRVPEEEQTMLAACTECYKNNKLVDEYGNKVGWYWPGSSRGYGDYDLKCKLCGKFIHLRDKNHDDQEEDQTDIQEQG